MTDQHPITLPPELRQRWLGQWNNMPVPKANCIVWMATQAARWGADQQLAEDAKWLDQHALDAPHLKITPVGESLKEAMRPKPPNLKEQALALLDTAQESDDACNSWNFDTIRRALEALPND